MSEPAPAEYDEAPPRDVRRTARLVGSLVVLALVIVFIVQNTQTVAVHYFTATTHPRFLFVALGCLVVGMLGGLMLGRSRRRRTERRRLAHDHLRARRD